MFRVNCILVQKKKFKIWSPSWISNLYYFSYFYSNSHLGTSNEGFKSISLSVKEQNYKIYFQDSISGSHLGFPTGMIKIFFIYKLPWYFLPKFESIGHLVQEKSSKYIFKMGMTMFWVSWHFHSGEKDQNRFSRGGHIGFWIRTILAIFYLQVAMILPTKFQINWPFGSGEDVQTRFSRWWTWQPFWILHLNAFHYFLSTSRPDISYQVFSQLAFGFWRSSSI